MNLRELNETINQILINNPEYAECPVILPSDDEGNSFREAYCMGISKYFDMENMEMHCDSDVEGDEEYDEEDLARLVPVFSF
jgi:hypothetical protein